MNAEYRAHLQGAADDPAVRVIVVTGAGRGFCAGAESDDLAGHVERGAYRSWDADDLATPGYGVRPEFDAELAYHFGIPKPILAAINGPAAGIGFALACYCDLRFAARGAKFTTAHGKLGLPCAFGLAWLLPKLIGLPRALDLILSSRTFDADEAHDLGLVTAVVDGPTCSTTSTATPACWPPRSPRPRWPPPSARSTRRSHQRRRGGPNGRGPARPDDGRARLPRGRGRPPREAGGRLRGPPRWRAPQPALTRRGEHRPGCSARGPTAVDPSGSAGPAGATNRVGAVPVHPPTGSGWQSGNRSGTPGTGGSGGVVPGRTSRQIGSR